MEQPAVNIRQIYYSLLRRCYTPDERTFVEGFILKHNLAGFIEDTLQQVEKLAELSNKAIPVDLTEIKTLSHQSLKTFNTAIAAITDQQEKDRIKALLAKFANLLQMEISQRTSLRYPQVNKTIKEGLEQAVHSERYNETDFKTYFPSSDIDVSRTDVSVDLQTNRQEYLIWDDEVADLDICVRLITSEYYYIKSVNDFKNIFSDPFCKTFLKCEEDKINHMILLFDRLWDKDMIILKGGNGFWLHLKKRLVDFRQKPYTFNFRKRAHDLKTRFSAGPVILNELDQIFDQIVRKH